MMMWPWPDGDPFGTGRGFSATENPDVRLTYEVAQRLQADPRTRDRRITVEVQSGVVLLEGSVGSPQVKQTAADTARATPGVRDVCNTLRADNHDTGSPAPPEPGPASSESPRWWSDQEISQQFDRLVAGLAAEPTPAGPVSGGARRWTWVAIAAAVATAWALLSVVIVVLGWLGVVIGCLCAAVTSAVINAVRGRRRPRANAAGQGAPSDHAG